MDFLSDQLKGISGGNKIYVACLQGIYDHHPVGIPGIISKILGQLKGFSNITLIVPRASVLIPGVTVIQYGLLERLINKFLQILARLKFINAGNHRLRIEILFDYFVSKNVEDGAVILSSAYLNRAINPARKGKRSSIHIAFNPHDRDLYELSLNVARSEPLTIDAYQYRNRIMWVTESLSKFDVIVGTTPVIFKSLYRRIPCKTVLVNLPAYCPNIEIYSGPSKLFKRVGGSTFTITFVAQAFAIKGLHIFLDALTQIPKYDTDSEVLIVGCTLTASQMKRMRLILGSRIKLTNLGFVDDLQSVYKQSDILVVPSLMDGNPSTVYEASELGVPVLLTDGCGASSYFINFESAIIVEKNSALALSRGIVWAMNNRERLVEIGTNASSTCERVHELKLRGIEELCRIVAKQNSRAQLNSSRQI